MKKTTSTIIIAAFMLILVSCKPAELNEVTFLSHDLEMELTIENHHANFSDSGVMQVNKGANMVYLTPDAKILDFLIGGKDQKFKILDSTALLSLNLDLVAKINALDPPEDALWLLFKSNSAGKVEFSINYESVFQADVTDVRFSNQNVGREVTGTILEKGAYFSPSSYYYPRGDDGLMSFEVTATIPATWESVADGNSLSNVTEGDKKIQGWKNPYQSDGLMFMAAPYVVGHVKAGDVDVYCYFFEADTALFETYLPATAGYVKMYSDLIGPYPYKRFTVAENFFPTGYGMPAWTLLGQQVIRLPFIVMTSLGHEVLHNWWGNSIYVDYEKGNWCEGLTVYGADYRYKLNRSAAGARDYRKDILKQYKSYVTPENEFPVRDFIARHNAESRTIGYNKAMMIFHMIENAIGTENFIQAWKDIYAEHKGEKVTWEQWIAAYEKSSGQDLSFVLPQWVDNVGAAKISVNLLESSKADGKTNIKFEVKQPVGEVYNLNIPVKFTGSEDHTSIIKINEASTTVDISVDGDVSAFELDPDYELFRHLYPQEIESIIAAAMGSKEKHFVYYSDNDKATIKSFGDNLTEGDITPVSGKDLVNMGEEGTYAIIALNPKELPASLKQKVTLGKKTVSINGTEYPRAGHTYILSTEEKEIAAKFLVVISDDKASLARVGQLIPHYGKYSYLVFKGSRNIAKGQWPALTSPLRVDL